MRGDTAAKDDSLRGVAVSASALAQEYANASSALSPLQLGWSGTLSRITTFVDVLSKRQHFPAAAFRCPTSELGGRSDYEMNFQYVGQPLTRGPAGAVLASESGSCAQCHEGTSKAVCHGSSMNHVFFDGHVELMGDLQGSDPSFWMPTGSYYNPGDAKVPIQPDVKNKYGNNYTSVK